MPYTPEQIERINRLRRFAPYRIYSREVINLYNKAMKVWGTIRYRPKYAREHEREIRKELEDLRKEYDRLNRVISERVRWLEFAPVDYEDYRRIRIQHPIETITETDTLGDVLYSVMEIIKENEERLKKIIVRREKIGTDTLTGFEIYYNFDTEKYDLIDERTGEVVKENIEEIELDVTDSCETGGGHEPFVAEITAKTKFSRKRRSEVLELANEIQRKIKDYIYEDYSPYLADKIIIKVGAEYKSEVEPSLSEGIVNISLEKKEAKVVDNLLKVGKTKVKYVVVRRI